MTPFDFAEYLDLADRLLAQGDEAALRSAVSRAYYALLHRTYEELPASLQATISYGAMHRQTWRIYGASSVPACRQIGQIGWRLRGARVDADYQRTASVRQVRSHRLVAGARHALELLRQHGYQP